MKIVLLAESPKLVNIRCVLRRGAVDWNATVWTPQWGRMVRVGESHITVLVQRMSKKDWRLLQSVDGDAQVVVGTHTTRKAALVAAEHLLLEWFDAQPKPGKL